MRARMVIINIWVIVLLFISTVLFAKEQNPERIISLSPIITDELYLLKMDDKLIGCTTYCKISDNTKKIDRVSSAIKVNLEKTVYLNPDLVLASSLTDTSATEKLKNLGIKVIIFPSVKSFNDICEQFVQLGKIVANEEKARTIIFNARGKTAIINKRVENFKKPKVFVQIGASPLKTINNDSFINDLIEFAGGINIARSLRNMAYSREQVLKDNPDIIIIVTMGINGQKEKRLWENFKLLNAAKNNRIHIIDSAKIAVPTPLSFVETLEEITDILHPNSKEKQL